MSWVILATNILFAIGTMRMLSRILRSDTPLRLRMINFVATIMAAGVVWGAVIAAEGFL